MVRRKRSNVTGTTVRARLRASSTENVSVAKAFAAFPHARLWMQRAADRRSLCALLAYKTTSTLACDRANPSINYLEGLGGATFSLRCIASLLQSTIRSRPEHVKCIVIIQDQQAQRRPGRLAIRRSPQGWSIQGHEMGGMNITAAGTAIGTHPVCCSPTTGTTTLCHS